MTVARLITLQIKGIGAVDACHAAIKARKPEDRFKIEERNALLYDHAINFDGSDEEKRAILAEALVANLSKIKTEIHRFRKSKFGEGGEFTRAWMAIKPFGGSGYPPRN
jgi:hypothetical protein